VIDRQMTHVIDVVKFLGKVVGTIYFPFRFTKKKDKAAEQYILDMSPKPEQKKFEFGPKTVTRPKIPVTLQSPAKVQPPSPTKASSPVKKSLTQSNDRPAQGLDPRLAAAPNPPWSFSANAQRARLPPNRAQTWTPPQNVGVPPANARSPLGRPQVVARRG